MRISLQIFFKKINGSAEIIRGLRKDDLWKKRKSRISWHCSFKHFKWHFLFQPIAVSDKATTKWSFYACFKSINLVLFKKSCFIKLSLCLSFKIPPFCRCLRWSMILGRMFWSSLSGIKRSYNLLLFRAILTKISYLSLAYTYMHDSYYFWGF